MLLKTSWRGAETAAGEGGADVPTGAFFHNNTSLCISWSYFHDSAAVGGNLQYEFLKVTWKQTRSQSSLLMLVVCWRRVKCLAAAAAAHY